MMQQDFCIVGDPVLLPLENSCDSDFSFCSTPASPQVSPRPTTSIKAESLIDSSFYYESTITSHTESMDQLFTPSTCGDTISQPPSTKPLRRREYKCPYCGRKSNRSNNMKEHILTHDPNRPKNFYCTVCPKRFARKHDLKRHHQSHERSIKKTMSTCGMVFCLD
ncbi:hypothetical protein BC941DRAFT_410354 [Chlamydoabsidia padenii]|nr:hypothetical protein BC941DRAFT_410354 [Chlamydoabsidia padenii]